MCPPTVTHIVHAAIANAKTKAYPKSVTAHPSVRDKDWVKEIQRAKKLSIEIG